MTARLHAVYGLRRVMRAEIVAFAAEFDPQPMHMDEAPGRACGRYPRIYDGGD
jgi:acyl dehydratase